MTYLNDNQISVYKGNFILKTASLLKSVSLDEFKKYINLVDTTTYDSEYSSYLQSAINGIEGYLNYNLLNTDYYYYQTNFTNLFYKVNDPRRSCHTFSIVGKGNINSVSEIAYIKTGESVYTILEDSKYEYDKSYHTNLELVIHSKETNGFPTDHDIRVNGSSKEKAVRAIVTIGFGATVNDIPNEIKLAIQKYATFLSANKGDVQSQVTGSLPYDIISLISHHRANELFI